MIKKIISIFLMASFVLSVVQLSVYAELKEVSEEVYSELGQTFTPLDLKPYANMAFADDVAGDGKGGWTDQGAINDMRNFNLRGRVQLSGVDFDIIDPDKNGGKSVITLRGQNLETLSNIAEVPVNQKAAGVYILHSAAWVVSNVATYSFVYEDGSQYDVPIRNNKEIFNFWGTGSSETCLTAWSGSNASTATVSLYMYAMENPYPDKTISKLIFKTTGSDAFCMIVGATLTDKGPYMMKGKDVGNPDTSNWYPYEMPSFDTIVGTPLDVSFVHDAPAGKHGYIKMDDVGKLTFDDGSKANFWGADVGPENTLIEHNRLDAIVDRFAALGFNLVRFHKFDAQYYGAKNIHDGGIINIDARKLDQLCYAISKYKEKGIYIYLDMRVWGSSSEDLNIRGSGSSVGYWFNDDMMKLDERYIRQLLGTYNPYTGMTIAEDPAIVFIDLKNENTLFSYTRDKSVGYTDELREKYNTWLKEKYGSDEELVKAWTYLGKSGLLPGESLENNSVEYGYSGEREMYNKPRQEDNLHFIADTMSYYYNRHKATFDELGYKGLSTACTLWGSNFPSLVYTLADGDVIDTHQYWSHPSTNYSMMTGTVTGFNQPISMLETESFGYMGYIFRENVYGMAHTITEWDECDMNPTMSEGYTLMAAFSTLQDWQPMNFGFYTNDRDAMEKHVSDGKRLVYNNTGYYGDPNILDAYWAINNNPIKMGCIPAASIMRLRGDVSEAETGFYERYSQNDYFNPDSQSFDTDPYIGLTGKTGLFYDKRNYDEEYNDDDVLYRAYMARKNKIPYVSVTGEMRTDMQNATFELNTERSQAVTGRITDKDFETDDMIVNISNPFANINLTSLSDKPIWDSDKLLLTAAGDQRNSDEVRSNDGKTMLRGGDAPILVEPICGRITIKTKDDISVYRLASTGRRAGTARVEKDENGYSVICLSEDDACMNFEIVRDKRIDGTRKANEHIVYDQIEVKPLFNDLSGYEWAEKAITRNCLLGDMTGISETEFAPGSEITRGDFVSAAVKACKLSARAEDNFADVSQNSSAYNAIGTAKALGIVTGDENGNFSPNEAISRADAMTILAKAMEAGNVQCKPKNDDALKAYADSQSVPAYAADSIAKMLSQDYVKELFNSNTFDPLKKLNRAEAAYIIYGILWR